MDILFINRDDGHPVCLSGNIPGRFAGEEAEPVCSGSDSNGHAGQSDLHCLLRVLPLPGLWHRTCRWGDRRLWQRVRIAQLLFSPHSLVIFCAIYNVFAEKLENDKSTWWNLSFSVWASFSRFLWFSYWVFQRNRRERISNTSQFIFQAHMESLLIDLHTVLWILIDLSDLNVLNLFIYWCFLLVFVITPVGGKNECIFVLWASHWITQIL